MSTPNLSIIMPVYNVEGYLHQAITSILQQSYTDFELLAVNDGSTDQSLNILTEYQEKDSRIVILDQSNRGLSAARNEGLAKAKGAYIYFFDSDDELVPHALFKIVSLAHKTDSDIVHFSALAIDEHGQEIKNFCKIGYDQEIPVTGKELFVKLMESGNYATNVQKYVVKKEILRKHHIFFDEGFIHEDESFTIEMLIQAKRVTSLNQPLMKKRFRSGSIMRSKKGIENIKGWLKAAIRLNKFIELNRFEKNVELLIRQKISQLTKISLKNLYHLEKNGEVLPDLGAFLDKEELKQLKGFDMHLKHLKYYMVKEKVKQLLKRFTKDNR